MSDQCADGRATTNGAVRCVVARLGVEATEPAMNGAVLCVALPCVHCCVREGAVLPSLLPCAHVLRAGDVSFATRGEANPPPLFTPKCHRVCSKPQSILLPALVVPSRAVYAFLRSFTSMMASQDFVSIVTLSDAQNPH